MRHVLHENAAGLLQARPVLFDLAEHCLAPYFSKLGRGMFRLRLLNYTAQKRGEGSQI